MEDIDFNSISSIKKQGFKGFKTVKELWMDNSSIPNQMGVYLVSYKDMYKPGFMSVGVGGHFKGKNPNVSASALKTQWVDNALVLYIGKAGGPGSGATLHSRIRQYLRFGQGVNVGHWGGRLIWQLGNHEELVFCWKPTPGKDPREIEIGLIQAFTSQYGKMPFANLTL